MKEYKSCFRLLPPEVRTGDVLVNHYKHHVEYSNVAIQRATEIIDAIKPYIDKNRVKYLEVDCGGSKSTAIPGIIGLSDKRFIIATDSKDRMAEYFDFSEYMLSGIEITADPTSDAIYVDSENRQHFFSLLRKGHNFHVIVVTSQYLASLSKEEVGEFVKGNIVLIDEVWNNVEMKPMSLGTYNKKTGDDSVPYHSLAKRDQMTNSDLSEEMGVIRKAVISSMGNNNSAILSDEIREMFGKMSDSLTGQLPHDLLVFRNKCDIIRNNKVICAKAYKSEDALIVVPVDLTALCNDADLFVNLDATATYNSSRHLVEHEVIKMKPLQVNATIYETNVATSKDSLYMWQDWSALSKWLRLINRAVIMPKEFVCKIDNDVTESVGYWGKDNKGTNRFKDKTEFMIIGGGDVPKYIHEANALYIYKDRFPDDVTIEQLRESEEYNSIVTDFMVRNLIQCMYRCAIRKHDTGIHCEIHILMKNTEMRKSGWEAIENYLCQRGGVCITTDESPVNFNPKTTKGKRKKFTSLAAYATKNSATGKFAKWLLTNNLKLSEAALSQYRSRPEYENDIKARHYNTLYDSLPASQKE